MSPGEIYSVLGFLAGWGVNDLVRMGRAALKRRNFHGKRAEQA